MSLLAIVDKPESAYAHWRIVRPFTRLQEEGYNARWQWVSPELNKNIRGKTIILQRTTVRYGATNAVQRFMNFLREGEPAHILYELDDDVLSESYVQYLRDCGRISPSSFAQVDHERQVQSKLISLCDGLVTTNQNLVDVVEKHCGPIKAYIIPNYIDIAWYTQRLTSTKRDCVTIGWAGGMRPEYEMEAMAQAWHYVARAYPEVMFVIAGYQPDILYSVLDTDRIIRLPYTTLEQYPANMQIDIGCIPLADTPFNKCKSPIKALEFGLSGASVVASDVLYSQYIKNALYVKNNNMPQWVEKIESLLEYKDVRRASSKALVDEIRAKWSLMDHLEDWTNLDGNRDNASGCMDSKPIKETVQSQDRIRPFYQAVS